MKKNINPQKSFGFIKILVLIVILIVILTILNIDIRSFVQTDLFQANWGFLKESILTIVVFFKDLWLEYGAEPTLYVWDNLLIPLLEKGISLIKK